MDKVAQRLRPYIKNHRKKQREAAISELIQANILIRNQIGEIQSDLKLVYKQLESLKNETESLNQPSPCLADELLQGPVVTLFPSPDLDQNVFWVVKPGETPDKTERIVVDCWKVKFTIPITYGRKVHMSFDAEMLNPLKYLQAFLDDYELPFTIDAAKSLSAVVNVEDWADELLYAPENADALKNGDETLDAFVCVLRIRDGDK